MTCPGSTTSDVPARATSGRAHNRALLAQCRALLRDLDDACMQQGLPADPANTIGGHLRHLLDHHGALLEGLATGVVDYGSRRRGTPCERERRATLARIEGLDDALARLSDADERATVQIVREDGSRSSSCVERELDFVASHATHHLAIVALLARAQGIDVAADLGVAVSTLRYRRHLTTET
jgi:uncharacterized damage-inducible protein DinB